MSNVVTVLLVEDNDIDVEAVKRGFNKHKIGNPIVVAHDGVEALGLLRKGKVPRPYVVLLDINMPRMNGIECLQEIRKDAELHDTVAFVLTTSDAEQDKIDAYGLNVAGYMLKGAVGEEFINLVNMFDHYWRVVELPTDPHA